MARSAETPYEAPLRGLTRRLVDAAMSDSNRPWPREGDAGSEDRKRGDD